MTLSMLSLSFRHRLLPLTLKRTMSALKTIAILDESELKDGQMYVARFNRRVLAKLAQEIRRV